MTFIEKLFKNRFNNGHSDEGIDPDELWAGISQQLPAEAVGQERAISRHWLLLLLLLLLFVGAFSYYFSAYSNEVVHTELAITDVDVGPLNVDLPPSITKPNTSKNTTDQLVATAKEQPLIMAPSRSIDEVVENSTLPIAKSFSVSSTTENVSSSSANINEVLIEGKTTASLDKMAGKKVDVVVRNSKTVLALDLPFSVYLTKTTPPSFPVVYRANNEEAAPLRKPVQIGLFSGVNIWKNAAGSTNPITDQLVDANDYSLGSTFAAEIQVKLAKQISLLTGISYYNTHHKFNYEQTWDTLMYRDNIPGGDLINALATRTVKHYNTLNFFSIPVLVSINHTFGKAAVGVEAGVTINYISQQNGKTINTEEEVINYANAETAPLPYSDVFMAYQLRPFLNYQVADKVKIQLRLEIGVQQFPQSDVYGSKYRAIQLGLSVGGVYAW